jgi:hypothetical protein
MSRSWTKGSTTRWRKLRAAILLANQQENRGRCTLQVPKVCTGTATQVHHLKGKAHGDDPRYLAAVCAACNLHVGDPNKGNPQPKRISSW